MRPAVMPCTACEDPAPRKAPAPPPTVAKSPSAFLLEWCSWRSPVPSSALLVLEAFARDASDLLAPARSSLAASGALGRPVARRAPTIPRPVPFRLRPTTGVRAPDVEPACPICQSNPQFPKISSSIIFRREMAGGRAHETLMSFLGWREEARADAARRLDRSTGRRSEPCVVCFRDK